MNRPALLPAILAAAAGCAPRKSEEPVLVAATATAIGAERVEIELTHRLAADSRPDAASFEIFVPFAGADLSLAVTNVESGGHVISLETETQLGGRTYAVKLPELTFEEIEEADAPSQVIFEGYGKSSVLLSLDARGYIVPGELTALVTVDLQAGLPSDRFSRVTLSDTDGDLVFTGTIAARIGQAHAYAARAVNADGTEAGALVRFSVTSTAAVRVDIPARLDEIPEFAAPVDPIVGDGLAPVRIVFDDRPARALTRPSLKSSLDADGRFDLAAARVDPMRRIPEKGRVWEVIIDVAVDPARRIGSETVETFPYIAFLVEAGEDLPSRGATFEVVEEKPQVIVIPVGNPALVPITFRVDAGSAILEPGGTPKGVYPGEGLFLTGEFPSSEDALGRLAADAFSGGERATLELAERPDAPGIYEKTVFMRPNRPYGWKVVRCATGEGCAALNRRVTSSGRAFPTVMKNLVTQNVDAAGSPAVRRIDPARLDRVELEGGQIADYSRARVSSDGMELAGPAIMFKQEVPDLVVNVGTEAFTTPIYVVGTWRDVNIPDKPADIIASGQNLNLAPFDYDDGMVGVAPVIRDLALPADPGIPRRPAGQPVFDATDGRADSAARQLTSPAGRLPLWVSWNERDLYVATSPATAGRDHFVIVSLDPLDAAWPAQWAKGGRSAVGPRTIFLATEGDGMFQAWFRRGAAGNDDVRLEGMGIASSQGDVVEGAIDLAAAGLGAAGEAVWIAVVAYGTGDGDPLLPDAQTPPGNGDFDVDTGEQLHIELSGVRAP